MNIFGIVKKIVQALYGWIINSFTKKFDEADAESKKKVERMVLGCIGAVILVVIATLLVVYVVKPEAYSALIMLVDALPNIENSTIILDVSLKPLALGGFNFDGPVPEFNVNLLVILGFVVLLIASVLIEKLNPWIAIFSSIAAPAIFVPGIIKAFNIYMESGLSAWDATKNLLWPLAITFVLAWSCSSVYIARETFKDRLRDIEKFNQVRESAFEKDISRLHKEREKIEADIDSFEKKYAREVEKAKKRWDKITKQYTDNYPYTINEQERYCKFVFALTGKQPNKKDYDYLNESLDEYDDSYEVFDEIMREERESQISKYQEKLNEVNEELARVEKDVATYDAEEVEDVDPLLYIFGLGSLAALTGGVILLAIAVALLALVKVSYLVCIPAIVVVLLTCISFIGAKKDKAKAEQPKEAEQAA